MVIWGKFKCFKNFYGFYSLIENFGRKSNLSNLRALKFKSVFVQVNSLILLELLTSEDLCQQNLKKINNVKTNSIKSQKRWKQCKKQKAFLVNSFEQLRKF